MPERVPNPGADPGPALVIFCRRPVPGTGKQRLARDLDQDTALAASRLLLDCALEDGAHWPGPVILAPAHAADREWAATLLAHHQAGRVGHRPQVLAQPAGNLGERIMAVDLAARSAGHGTLCFIGSDAPVLTPALYAEVIALLSRTDVVLADADDGGVTLMASRRGWPDLRDLPWSTAALGTALAARCTASGLHVQRIPGGYDIDVAADLPRLARDLAEDPRPARRRLYQWLRALGY